MKTEKPWERKFRFVKKRPPILAVFLICVVVLLLGAKIYKSKTENKVTTSDTENIPEVTSETTAVMTPSVDAKSVCLDPGHGGNDIGASYGTVSESKINLIVALKIRDRLENLGYKVYMTRTTDEYVAKRDRAYMCNDYKADIMVAIHHNAYDTDTSVDYGTALYYKASDLLLASNILDATSNKLSVKNQGMSKFNDSQLWLATMPATLTEAFFITNSSEYRQIKVANSARLSDEAEAIATGIDKYFTNPKEAGTTVDSGSLIIDRID